MERAFIHQSAPLVTITGENQYNAVKLELPEKVQSAFDALISRKHMKFQALFM